MLSARAAKYAVLALVGLGSWACGSDQTQEQTERQCDAPSGGPDGSPLKLWCETDTEHQCENVYSYIKVCEAQLTCALASESALMAACQSTPLTFTQYAELLEWTCGDVKYAYCGSGGPAGCPTWLCR